MVLKELILVVDVVHFLCEKFNECLVIVTFSDSGDGRGPALHGGSSHQTALEQEGDRPGLLCQGQPEEVILHPGLRPQGQYRWRPHSSRESYLVWVQFIGLLTRRQILFRNS